MALGEKPEATLDVAAGDGVQRAREPVAELQGRVTAVAPFGLAVRPWPDLI